LASPGVVLLNGLGGRATTGANGIAVVRLPSLKSTKISIDPDTAPDGLNLESFSTVVHRRGGVALVRHPENINGRFIEIDGIKSGSVLIINSEKYPVTDRGAWIELPAGSYIGYVGEKQYQVLIK